MLYFRLSVYKSALERNKSEGAVEEEELSESCKAAARRSIFASTQFGEE